MLHVKNSRFPPAHVWPVRAACPLYSGVIVSLGTKNPVSKEAADFLIMWADESREELENFQILPLHSTTCSFLHGKAEKVRLPSETIQRPYLPS